MISKRRQFWRREVLEFSAKDLQILRHGELDQSCAAYAFVDGFGTLRRGCPVAVVGIFRYLQAARYTPWGLSSVLQYNCASSIRLNQLCVRNSFYLSSAGACQHLIFLAYYGSCTTTTEPKDSCRIRILLLMPLFSFVDTNHVNCVSTNARKIALAQWSVFLARVIFTSFKWIPDGKNVAETFKSFKKCDPLQHLDECHVPRYFCFIELRSFHSEKIAKDVRLLEVPWNQKI